MSKLFIGDCRESLKSLVRAGVKVQMCVTSPPYFAMRSYLPQDHPLKSQEVGAEVTPSEYVSSLVEVFSLVKELLVDDGTLWVNLGDGYATHSAKGPGGGQFGKAVKTGYDDVFRKDVKKGARESGLKEKDLIGMPWMLAFALRDSGYYLRSSIIWAKGTSGQRELMKQVADSCIEEGLEEALIERILSRIDPYVGSCMPESIKDRPSRSHEDLFLFSKSQRYFYDRMAIAEEALFAKQHANKSTSWGTDRKHPNKANVEKYAHKGNNSTTLEGGKRNRRTVWTITTRPSRVAHFATFPPELIEPCILAGSRLGDLVLDPFMGSGTVAGVCEKLGRYWIGCELSEEFAALIPKRIQEIVGSK